MGWVVPRKRGLIHDLGQHAETRANKSSHGAKGTTQAACMGYCHPLSHAVHRRRQVRPRLRRLAALRLRALRRRRRRRVALSPRLLRRATQLRHLCLQPGQLGLQVPAQSKYASRSVQSGRSQRSSQASVNGPVATPGPSSYKHRHRSHRVHRTCALLISAAPRLRYQTLGMLQPRPAQQQHHKRCTTTHAEIACDARASPWRQPPHQEWRCTSPTSPAPTCSSPSARCAPRPPRPAAAPPPPPPAAVTPAAAPGRSGRAPRARHGPAVGDVRKG